MYRTTQERNNEGTEHQRKKKLLHIEIDVHHNEFFIRLDDGERARQAGRRHLRENCAVGSDLLFGFDADTLFIF